VTRLLLVRHAPTAATERGAFAADEPITDEGRHHARSLALALPPATQSVSSPLLRARQTAEAAGCSPEFDPRLAECGFGEWTGTTFAELAQQDPRGLDAWLSDPDVRPPGGESLSCFAARVGDWLGEVGTAAKGNGDTTLAFTHGGVTKVALVTALGAPLASFWQLTISPLSITELVRHGAGWTVVRMNWTVAL
jgi:broad specificity phosphatase PhoE